VGPKCGKKVMFLLDWIGLGEESSKATSGVLIKLMVRWVHGAWRLMAINDLNYL
jgi:hypothetical protein